jgi:hypothetical protein
MRLPKYVSKQTTQHGKIVYYFRRGHSTRIRLPDIESPDFQACYADAIAARPVLCVRDMPLTPITVRKQSVEAAMKASMTAARTRSKERNLPFDLTLDWLLDTVEAQGFRCSLTGIEFYTEPPHRGKVDPYAPSLDQIEPGQGYTMENVRIVIFAVNMMLCDWGPKVFEQVANSYRYWQRKN